jgi:uncharacterized membrane protein YebE (DUF533 family)
MLSGNRWPTSAVEASTRAGGAIEFLHREKQVIDPNKIVDQLMRGGPGGGASGGLVETLLKSGLGGGLAGGLLSGAVARAGTGGKGGKLGKKALKVGGMALVAGIAWKAYQNYQQQQSGRPAASAPASSGWPEALPVQRAAADPGHGLAVLRGMIAAAKSDGAIDADEQQRIFVQLGQLDLSAEEKAFVLEELARPLDIDAVVAASRDPGVAAEAYAASRLVIAEASPAEQAYLSLLAARLNLEPGLVGELDRRTADLARA